MLITYLSSSSTSLIKTWIERSIKGTTAKTLSKSITFVVSPPSDKSQLLLLLPSQFETSTNLTSPIGPLLLNLQRRRSRTTTSSQAPPQPKIPIPATLSSTTRSSSAGSRRAWISYHSFTPESDNKLCSAILPHQHQPLAAAPEDHQKENPPCFATRTVQVEYYLA